MQDREARIYSELMKFPRAMLRAMVTTAPTILGISPVDVTAASTERAQAEFSRSCCLAAEACQRAIDGAVRDREDNLRLLFPPPDPKESGD